MTNLKVLIYHPSALTQEDKDRFLQILKYAQLDSFLFEFVNVEYHDIDTNSPFNICLGQSLFSVGKAFVKAKKFRASQLVGYDIVIPEYSFFLYNLPYTVDQIFGDQEVKELCWTKILSMKESFESFKGNHLNSVTPDASVENSEKTTMLSADILPSVEDTVIASEEVKSKCNLEITDSDIFDFFRGKIDLTDPSVKFSNFEKMSIHTKTGDVVTIVPRKLGKTRPDENILTLKEMMILLRISEFFGIDHIKFFKQPL
jgi:hypothetical protein